MTADSTAIVRSTWIRAGRLDPAVLTRPLTDLHLPARVLRACRALGLCTIADALGTADEDFLALPGVAARSWQTLVVALRRALAELATDAEADPGDEALAARFPDPRTRLALARLGCPSRAALQQAGRDAALAVPGLQAADYDAVVLENGAAATLERHTTLWPDHFVRRRIADLELEAAVEDALLGAGVTTFADLMGTEPQALAARARLDAAGIEHLRLALARALSTIPLPRRVQRPADGGLRRLLRALDDDDRAFLVAHVGLDDQPPASRTRLARQLGFTLAEFAEREARCRTSVHGRCLSLLARWRRAAERELIAQDGAVHGERVPKGPLKAMAAVTGDPVAPLRLLAFLFPAELYLVGNVLTTVDGDTCKRLVHALRALRPSLPRPLLVVEAELAGGGLPVVSRGLLLHLLHHDAHVQVVIDPEIGEMLHRRRTTVGDRIEHVLRDARTSLTVADLQFRYRDRYGRARRARLLDNLWAEPRFLEVGPGLWDLRERHVDQAELIEAEAARLRDTICTVGGRHHVADLVEGGLTSERVLYLLRDRLRRDPALRNLGRGAFCARSLRTSTQMEALQRALRAAGGEVPFERFLANQDRATRRLRTRLLRENRLFLEVAEDRIDALSNYPFNVERLRSLLRTVEFHLEQHDGYDRVDRVLAAVAEVGLGGDYLTPHLLRDLLVRQGPFELLADDLVALRSRGLKAWIQQRAREAIRRATHGLTTFEIQNEVPDLAQFASCLDRVIGADPMVQSPDGLHYMVV